MTLEMIALSKSLGRQFQHYRFTLLHCFYENEFKKRESPNSMCVDFTDFNKTCPNDSHPLPSIETDDIDDHI